MCEIYVHTPHDVAAREAQDQGAAPDAGETICQFHNRSGLLEEKKHEVTSGG